MTPEGAKSPNRTPRPSTFRRDGESPDGAKRPNRDPRPSTFRRHGLRALKALARGYSLGLLLLLGEFAPRRGLVPADILPPFSTPIRNVGSHEAHARDE